MATLFWSWLPFWIYWEKSRFQGKRKSSSSFTSERLENDEYEYEQEHEQVFD